MIAWIPFKNPCDNAPQTQHMKINYMSSTCMHIKLMTSNLLSTFLKAYYNIFQSPPPFTCSLSDLFEDITTTTVRDKLHTKPPIKIQLSLIKGAPSKTNRCIEFHINNQYSIIATMAEVQTDPLLLVIVDIIKSYIKR